jgi:hypothetical protein
VFFPCLVGEKLENTDFLYSPADSSLLPDQPLFPAIFSDLKAFCHDGPAYHETCMKFNQSRNF